MAIAVPKIGQDPEELKKAKMAALQPRQPSLQKPIPLPPKSQPTPLRPTLGLEQKPPKIDVKPSTPVTTTQKSTPRSQSSGYTEGSDSDGEVYYTGPDPDETPPPPVARPYDEVFDGTPQRGVQAGGAGGQVGGLGSINVTGPGDQRQDHRDDPFEPGAGQEGMTPAEIDARSGVAGTGSPADFDQSVADLLLKQITGASNVDTREDERLINQRLGDDVGKALVNQRASMGRSGFGSSGALGAMEGDIQRQARQAALGETLGLRRSERDRALDNAFRGIGADIDMREQKEDEFFNKALLDAIRSSQGLEDDGGVGGGGGVGEISFPPITAPPTDVQDIITGDQQQNETATVGGRLVTSQPAGFEFYQTLSNGDTLYRNPKTGEVVKMPKASTPTPANPNDRREGGNRRQGG